MEITAYKVMRERRDGTLGPLFCGASLRVTPGAWMEAEEHPTKGLAFRPGWHAVRAPDGAPHLKLSRGRVIVRVTLRDVTTYDRPAAQGGAWYLAGAMRVDAVVARG